MAENVKAAASKARFDKTKFVAAVKAINKAKEKAAEQTGLAGKATSEACEQHGFDKKALTFVANLSRKEPDQQMQTIAAVVTYAEAMGMFDQLDLFSDALGTMQAVIERAQAGTRPPSPGSDTVARLAAVN